MEPTTEIQLICGTALTIKGRIQEVHNAIQTAAADSSWTTASFIEAGERGNRVEVAPAAVTCFRIRAGNHGL